MFNLAGVLAYNLLLSAFPILLLLLAVSGYLFGAISPGSQAQLQATLQHALPGTTGASLLIDVAHSLHQSAPLLLVLGFVFALINGSNLFVVLENCLDMVFKLRGRNPIRQRVMALGMVLLYVVTIPVLLLAAILPATLVRLLGSAATNPVGAFLVQAGGIALSVVVALVLFGAVYVVVPNRRVRLREAWKGTLSAAVLLVLYDLLFPVYVALLLRPQNYGSAAGFAIVILIFFYYLAFILLLGAEINSWAAGQREMAGSLIAILHEVQAHNTTRGAAGPTAGLPAEDLQSHVGAAAMRSAETAIEHERTAHRHDELPPKYAESGVDAPGFLIESEGEHRQVDAEVSASTHAAARARSGVARRPRPKLARSLPEALRLARQLRLSAARSWKSKGAAGAASDADEDEPGASRVPAAD